VVAGEEEVVGRSELPVYARQIFRAQLAGESTVSGHAAGKTVFEDDSVRIWHLEQAPRRKC